MLHLVAVFDLRDADVALFERYEEAVLPLLGDYEGLLMSRVRAEDAMSEIHVLRFGSKDAYAAYQADPRRAAAADLLAVSRARVHVVPVNELGGRRDARS